MAIFGISSAGSSYGLSGVSGSTSSASETRNIERQIKQLQKELEQVQKNDQLDEESKAQLIQLYETQIMQLQVQLSNIAATSGAETNSARVEPAATQAADERTRTEGAFGPPPAPPSLENLVNNLSDDELTTLLKEIQEKTGSIPGIEGEVDLDNLSSDDLQEIRKAMVAEMRDKMQPPQEMQRRSAIASYEGFLQAARALFAEQEQE